MNEKLISYIIGDTLNAAYTYLKPKYDETNLNQLKKQLLNLAGIKAHHFSVKKNEHDSYENIQETLSTLNEKESIRKSKGVYYTPSDVVRFILLSSIKSVYGQLTEKNLHIMDLDGIPYRSFCSTKLVLDPTCGAGEFLLAALETKLDLLDCYAGDVTADIIQKTLMTIHGNDINRESVTIAKIRLFLSILKRYGVQRCSSLDQILNQNFTNYDFVTRVPEFNVNFDVIIGNPPYVEDSKSELYPDKKFGNIYANVLKNASDILAQNGSIGFVIPLSYVSTPRMRTIRNELFSSISEQYVLSYADRPDCLFKSVHQKLCILIGNKRNGEKKVYTGNYQYWYKKERANLFERTAAVKNNFMKDAYIPKLGTPLDAAIYQKVCSTEHRESLYDMPKAGNESVFLNMRATFWIKAFRCFHKGSEYKQYTFLNTGEADYFSCLLNSSLFWWYWICISDCWHITNKELKSFMVPELEDYTTVARLANALEKKLEKTKERVNTIQTEYEYKHKSCIDEIREIDDYINKLFGLTEEESLYIKNFAYRYRVSGGAEQNEGD